jgi:hypothetical protein
VLGADPAFRVGSFKYRESAFAAIYLTVNIQT